jgi:hypothetical protein
LPWSRRKWNKYSTKVSIFLGLVASIPINLATSWFQLNFLSNIFSLFFAVILIGAIFYLIKKLNIPLLTNAFWIMTASVFLNLFATWIQENVLHNSFTPSNVTLILVSTIVVLALSALLDPKVLTRFENRMKGRYKRSAKNNSISLAARGKTTGRTTTRKKKLPPMK